MSGLSAGYAGSPLGQRAYCRGHYAHADRHNGANEPVAEDAPIAVGHKGIRIKAMSAGAVQTCAASGIVGIRSLIDSCEIGRTALLLASDYTAAITGEVLYVDGGFHVEGMVFR